jgi:cytochrome c peroxidase
MMNTRQKTLKPDRRPRRSLRALSLGLTLCLVSAEHGAAAEPIKPVPITIEVNEAKAELGRRLFHDPRLSKNDTISCATCHDLSTGGDDGQVVSTGIEGRVGLVNSPTVFNSAFNFKQFWDGRAHTLKDQIDGPLQSRIEMESIWPDVVTKLFQDEDYPWLFREIYPNDTEIISRENIKEAIAEFMRSLITPNSRFDQWLRGDTEAISEHEREGYALFKRYGCVSCHQGASVGGNMFQVFGVINDYFRKRGNITDADLGRFNVTGNEVDKHAFKVPSLRMAAHTAPYLHDGSAKTLRDAVDAMFEFQLGREAPDDDKEAIVAFIKTLAGEYEEKIYRFDLGQDAADGAQESPVASGIQEISAVETAEDSPPADADIAETISQNGKARPLRTGRTAKKASSKKGKASGPLRTGR